MRLHLGSIVVSLVLVASSGCGNTRGALAEVDAGAGEMLDAAARDEAEEDEASSPLAETCTTQAPPETCPEAAPTYGEIAPIIDRRCAMCHGVPNGAWPLDTYQDVAAWFDSLQSTLLDCSMPPADAGVSMTADERLTILNWIHCGRLH